MDIQRAEPRNVQEALGQDVAICRCDAEVRLELQQALQEILLQLQDFM